MVKPDDDFYFTIGHSPDPLVQLRTDERPLFLIGLEDYGSIRFTDNTESTNAETYTPTDEFWETLVESVDIVHRMHSHKSELTKYNIPEEALSMTTYEVLENPCLPKYEMRAVTYVMEVIKVNIEDCNSIFRDNQYLIALLKRAYDEVEQDYPYYLIE